jgi:prevent-host-death family protein
MATVGIKELKVHTTKILQKVRDDGQPIDITLRGEVIARIVPVQRSEQQRAQTLAACAAADEFTLRLGGPLWTKARHGVDWLQGPSDRNLR